VPSFVRAPTEIVSHLPSYNSTAIASSFLTHYATKNRAGRFQPALPVFPIDEIASYRGVLAFVQAVPDRS
jgi:hypothetical protein